MILVLVFTYFFRVCNLFLLKTVQLIYFRIINQWYKSSPITVFRNVIQVERANIHTRTHARTYTQQHIHRCKLITIHTHIQHHMHHVWKDIIATRVDEKVVISVEN